MNPSGKKFLFIIIGAAFILRLASTIPFLIHPENGLTHPDAPKYHQLATNLLRHHVFSEGKEPPFQIDSIRTPGYPTFLAFIYGLFGINIKIAILFQILLSILSCLIVYKLGQIIFQDKRSLIAASLMAISPVSILYANQLVTETLFTLLLLSSIYFLFRSPNNIKIIAVAGLLLGLATLNRPISIFLPILLIPFIILKSKKITLSATFIICAYLLPTFWGIRNYLSFKKIFYSSTASYNIYWCEAPQIIALKNNITPSEGARIFKEKLDNCYSWGSETEWDSIGWDPQKAEQAAKLGLKIILDNPLEFTKIHLTQAMSIILSPISLAELSIIYGTQEGTESLVSYGTMSLILQGKLLSAIHNIYQKRFISFPKHIIILLFFVFFYHAFYLIFCLIGLISLRKAPFKLFFLVFLILYFIILVSVQGNARFRVPIEPYLALITAAGIHWFKKLRANTKFS